MTIDNRLDIDDSADGDFASMMMELGELGKDVFFAMSAAPLGDTLFICNHHGVHFRIDMGNVQKSLRERIKCPTPSCTTVLTKVSKDTSATYQLHALAA